MAQHMEVSKVEKRKRDSEETPRYKHNLKPEESDSADEVQEHTELVEEDEEDSSEGIDLGRE